MSTRHPAAIPVCVISGFLGSGKTTLLNNILNGDHGLKVTVMVNDFGAINIDTQLLDKQQGNTISLNNGCICCSIQNDLVYELEKVVNQPDGAPEYIVIETSGVSDPNKIINVLRYPQLRDRFQLDTVLTLINAETINDIEGQVRQLAMAQLDAADIIVINKTDCVNDQAIQQIHKDWLYPSARVLETCYAEVPQHILFGDGVTRPRPESLPETLEQDHSELFQSWSWRTDKPVCLTKLRAVINSFPRHIYRAKGILHTRQMSDIRVVMQLVGSRQEWERREPWVDQPFTELVVIGAAGSFDPQQLQSDLEACTR